VRRGRVFRIYHSLRTEYGDAIRNQAAVVDSFHGKPRVLVLTDIGNEPDDQMSLTRFLLYSNEFDIEGLVATTSTWQKASPIAPERG
jgi:cellulose-binding protein